MESPPSADPPPPTLATIIASDVCEFIARHFSLTDFAALAAALLPLCPQELWTAIESNAMCILADAPLFCAADNFVTAAIWPLSVAASNWCPREFFGALRAPAFCRVTGSGRCAHGLCQKQEEPKEGVVEILDWLARDDSPPSVRVVSLECLAWLHGALGRRDAALDAWMRAARAGSARALLDIGVRSYMEGTASTVYCMPSTPKRLGLVASSSADNKGASNAAAKSTGAGAGAEPMLRKAARHPSLDSLPNLEGHVIRTKAHLYLGMMALDGDGCAQDDDAAHASFVAAAKAAKAGLLAWSRVEEEQTRAAPEPELEPVQPEEHRFWSTAASPSWRRFGTVLKQLLNDAEESIQGLEGPTPSMYRNA